MESDSVAQLVVEKIKLCVMRQIPHAEVESWRDPSSRADDVADYMVVQIRTYLAGVGAQRIEEHHQWPRDWWQALRERWFPAWWLKRWPVKWDRVDISDVRYERVCPHLELPRDDVRHKQFLSGDAPVLSPPK